MDFLKFSLKINYKSIVVNYHFGGIGIKIFLKNKTVGLILVVFIASLLYTSFSLATVAGVSATAIVKPDFPTTSSILTGNCSAVTADPNTPLQLTYEWYKDNQIFISGEYFLKESVSVGYNHACGIRAKDNRVLCWGDNGYGQLGDGTKDMRNQPTLISDTDQYKSIATGTFFTCGIRSKDGRVLCWGLNNYGQLGDGSKTLRLVPTLTSNSDSFKQVSLGSDHGCVIRESDGRVLCWGRNYYGNLGDGTQTDRLTPTYTSDSSSYKKIKLGNWHTCGIRDSDGRVLCWGYNNNGNLGDGSTTQRIEPTLTSDTSAYKTIALGGHSCGVRESDGRVLCWGANNYGKLGDGSTTQRTTPTLTSDTSAYKDVAASDYNSCGVREIDGRVLCWGYNTNGQIGDGSTTVRQTPTLTTDNSDYAYVSAGGYFACGVRINDGRVLCWGANFQGALGDGTSTNRYSPTLTLDSDLYLLKSGFNVELPKTVNGSETYYGDEWELRCKVSDGISNLEGVDSVFIQSYVGVNNLIVSSASGCGAFEGSNLIVDYDTANQLSNPTYSVVDWRINSTSLAVLNMPFNLGGRDYFRDYSSYKNTGISSLSTLWTSLGKIGGALDSSSGHVSISDDTSLDITDEITLEAWVKTTDQGYVIKKNGQKIQSEEYIFTNCGQTGKDGPSQAQCDSSYSATSLNGLVTVSSGIQYWTVPETGTYIIEAYGAQGGYAYLSSSTTINPGQKGAYISGEVDLTQGDVLKILVGQQGTDNPKSTRGGGGGGGSYVAYNDNTPIIIAGGGGGSGQYEQTGGEGQTGTSGTAGLGSGASAGGTSGAGGYSSSYCGGGAGWNANGASSSYGKGGLSFINGGTGGAYYSDGKDGGFGGGAGTYACAAGGGGYSGGGAGGWSYAGRGGGGGSYNSGINQDNVDGINTGHGQVNIIHLIESDVPYYLSTESGGKFLAQKTNDYSVTSSISVNDGNWHHLAATYDGSLMKIYVDGVERGSQSVAIGTLSISDAKLEIGKDLSGIIDEVKIYDRALSPQQIQLNYNYGLVGAASKELSSNEFGSPDQVSASVTAMDIDAPSVPGVSPEVTIEQNYCSGVQVTDKTFTIKNKLGTECMKVNEAGNIWIGGKVYEGESSLSPPAGSFVVKDSLGNAVFYVDSACTLKTKGVISDAVASIATSGSGDLYVRKKSDMSNVFKIANTGNVYTKGTVGFCCSS